MKFQPQHVSVALTTWMLAFFRKAVAMQRLLSYKKCTKTSLLSLFKSKLTNPSVEVLSFRTLTETEIHKITYGHYLTTPQLF